MASSRSITRLHAVNNSTPQASRSPSRQIPTIWPIRNLSSWPLTYADRRMAAAAAAADSCLPGVQRLGWARPHGRHADERSRGSRRAFADLAMRDAAAVAMRAAVAAEAQQATDAAPPMRSRAMRDSNLSSLWRGKRWAFWGARSPPMVGPRHMPPSFWFRADMASARWRVFFVRAAMAGRGTLSSRPAPNSSEHFDRDHHAIADAVGLRLGYVPLAVAAGGQGERLSRGACCMLRGMACDREVELAFLDCRRRIQ